MCLCARSYDVIAASPVLFYGAITPADSLVLKMEDVKNSLKDLTESVKDSVDQNQIITQRLVVLERDTVRPAKSEEQIGSPQAISTSQTASVELNLQGDFQTIKDTLARVRLPASLKVPVSKAGIRSQYSHQCSVIQKCGKYAETTFKLISLLDPDNKEITNSDVQDIYTIQAAQEEFASLVVESKYGSEPANKLRSLQ